MCGARTTSIPSERSCVVDGENLRHLTSVRLACMRCIHGIYLLVGLWHVGPM